MASTESVRARERDNLLVLEAHPAEDLAQVVAFFWTRAVADVGVGEPPVGGDGARVHLVDAAVRKLELWAAHGLDGDDADCKQNKTSV